MSLCKLCGKSLDADDVGATLKFLDRSASDFLCVPCLASRLGCTEPYLRERIEFLRRNGCGLFPKGESAGR